jgi:hypothetical protein
MNYALTGTVVAQFARKLEQLADADSFKFVTVLSEV